ncbi:hypothetical protein CB1_002764003 [Camelus ferus]|nr:hypothetical protein CB1_002764003 [Camelus ferus]
MVSQVLQLLRQGVWAALTGGWYHDPEQSTFTNSFHLYLWLFLLLLPLAMHLAFPPNAITVFFYCSLVTIFFTVIKLVSYRLHLMFDKGELIQQTPSRKKEKPDKDKEANSVILSEDQPGAPVPSTSPGIRTESLPVSKANAQETTTTPARPVMPVMAERCIGDQGKGRPPFHHRSEGGLVDKEALRKSPHLSLSQYDLLETDVSFQPWGSENSVLMPDPGHHTRGSIREHMQSQASQDSLSSSCPRCDTVIAKPVRDAAAASQQVDRPVSQDVDHSDSEVAVTLIDTSQPGDPLSLHEPIKIVITMSSTQNSMTDLESSLHLKVIGTEGTGLESDAQPATPGVAGPPNVEQMRIPVITLELSEDGGGGIVCPEGTGGDRTPERLMAEPPSNQCSGYESGEGGNATKDCSPSPRDHSATTPPPTTNVVSDSPGAVEGQATLDPSSCRTGHEKRHARVLSVDSGTDVLSKSSADIITDKEKTIPTSKSDLEAKEGQMPNESNFLEFVSLLESINTSKGVASNQGSEPAEQTKDSGLLGGTIPQHFCPDGTKMAMRCFVICLLGFDFANSGTTVG